MRSSWTEHRGGERTGAGTHGAPTRATWVRLAVALLVGAGAAVTPAVGTTSALLTDTDALTATVSTGTWATPTPAPTTTEPPAGQPIGQPGEPPAATAPTGSSGTVTDARPAPRRGGDTRGARPGREQAVTGG